MRKIAATIESTTMNDGSPVRTAAIRCSALGASEYLLGFGSNRHPEQAWRFAQTRLADLGTLVWHSEPTPSAACGDASTDAAVPDYHNALVILASHEPAYRLERRLKQIERECGQRERPWVPLDIDLLARRRSDGRLRQWPRRDLAAPYWQAHLAVLPLAWEPLHGARVAAAPLNGETLE